jgi:glycerate dehydrogenase
MKIVVLNGYTLNPGDLSWKELEKFGKVEIFDRTPAASILKRAAGAGILLTNKTVLDASVISQLAHLRYIGVLATGFNVVDLDAARKHGIIVTNVPAYGIDSVAQMCFAHILNLTNWVAVHAAGVSQGQWCKAADFFHSPEKYPGISPRQTAECGQLIGKKFDLLMFEKPLTTDSEDSQKVFE